MDRATHESLKRIAERLKRECGAQKVILYGSYARGEETADSDIDLLVIIPTTDRMIDRMTKVRRAIRDLRNGLPISPVVLTPKELEDRLEAGDSFVRAVIEEGIAL